MTFRGDFHGIGEMLNSAEMQADMLRRANAGAAFAESVAPYDAKTDGTHYRDAFEVTSGALGGVHHDRAYATLSNTDGAALWVEIGSKNNAAHHVLGRALDVMEADL